MTAGHAHKSKPQPAEPSPPPDEPKASPDPNPLPSFGQQLAAKGGQIPESTKRAIRGER